MTEEDSQKRDAREPSPLPAGGPAVARQVHIGALAVYKWLPVRLKRLVLGWMTPSFHVGAGLVVQRADGCILFVRHSYRKGWGLPGGNLKRDEQPAEAARREAFEELGVEFDIDPRPVVTIDPDYRQVDVVYRARLGSEADADRLVPQSPEIVELAWFPPDDPPRLQRGAARALAELGVVPKTTFR